jgi:predicted nucleic acid-binding protein
MRGDKCFVDSGLILYTYDTTDAAKRARAEAWLGWLWESSNGALSWQVLQEFYGNAVGRFGAKPDKARLEVTLLSEWSLADVTLGMMERAWFWTDQAQLTFWEAMIVAAAERLRCRWLLSEDFQEGLEFGAVTVLNPFTADPPRL